jgi:hypothetical protein
MFSPICDVLARHLDQTRGRAPSFRFFLTIRSEFLTKRLRMGPAPGEGEDNVTCNDTRIFAHSEQQG